MSVRALLALIPALAGCTADTFVAADAGSDAAPGPTCGSLQCAATETCCVSSAASPTFSCLATCPAQQNGVPVASLACTSTADCAGTICCVHVSNNVTISACEAQCGSNEVQLCNPSAANPGCPAAAPCSSSNIQDWKLPQSFGTCGGRNVP